jgi:hypothetical protein
LLSFDGGPTRDVWCSNVPTRCGTKLSPAATRAAASPLQLRVASFFLQAIGPSRSVDAGQE